MTTTLYRMACCLFALLLSQQLTAQSKKEQIELLNNEIDSLKKLIQFKDGQITEHVNQNKSLANQIRLLNASNDSLIAALQNTKAQLSALQATNFNRIECSQEEIEIINETDESDFGENQKLAILTCRLRNFKIIDSIYYDDISEKYDSHMNSYYKMIDGAYEKIRPSQLFNDRVKELENLLNRKFKEEYLKMKQENSDCFEDFQFTSYTFDGKKEFDYISNNIDITISGQNEMTFGVEFDLTTACTSVSGSYVTLKIEELIPFFAE